MVTNQSWILTAVQSHADDLGDLDWVVALDTSIMGVHQHGATRPGTRGWVELHESGRGAA